MSRLAEVDDDCAVCALCFLMWVCLKTGYSTIPQKDRCNRTRHPIFRQTLILTCVRSEHLGMCQTLWISSIYVRGWTSSHTPAILRCFGAPLNGRRRINKHDKMMAGWWFGTFFIFPYFSIYWEFHHPNWLICFRGVGLNHQPDGYKMPPELCDAGGGYFRNHWILLKFPHHWTRCWRTSLHESSSWIRVHMA